jgi:hypothetical protein
MSEVEYFRLVWDGGEEWEMIKTSLGYSVVKEIVDYLQKTSEWYSVDDVIEELEKRGDKEAEYINYDDISF